MYRARAHSNPLNDSLFDVPTRPEDVDWSQHYPAYFPDPSANPAASFPAAAGPPPAVRFADIGCGFGGLLVKLSTLYPETLILGMELRDKARAAALFAVRKFEQLHGAA